jgi:carboxypeptidase Taq
LTVGDFGPLRAWLRANVHSKVSLLETEELLKAAIGEPLQAEVFHRHLRGRYLGIEPALAGTS